MLLAAEGSLLERDPFQCSVECGRSGSFYGVDHYKKVVGRKRAMNIIETSYFLLMRTILHRVYATHCLAVQARAAKDKQCPSTLQLYPSTPGEESIAILRLSHQTLSKQQDGCQQTYMYTKKEGAEIVSSQRLPAGDRLRWERGAPFSPPLHGHQAVPVQLWRELDSCVQ